jgi:hypothetical protein
LNYLRFEFAVAVPLKGVRKPFAAGAASGTDGEKVGAFDNYIAYYGTYEVDLFLWERIK